MNEEWSWIEPLLETPLARWCERLPTQVAQMWQERPHGDLNGWRKIIDRLPSLQISEIDLQGPVVRVGAASDGSEQAQQQIASLMKQLHPWRKGPYQICGVEIDAEWRSNMKWDRLSGEIESLQGRLVLDVGCGNGYYGWRMLGAGAKQVIGIDPTQLFVMQFEAMRRYIGETYPLHVLPLGIENLPPNLQAFDTVFSMGVFYHRRSPFSHLAELKGALRRDGQLVLETLVIEGGAGEVLVPQDRYAKMRNVWFIPTPATLEHWLSRAGFRNIRLIDVSVTNTNEQRPTEWMQFESLVNFLDAEDPSRTVEGYPAPRRALFLANA